MTIQISIIGLGQIGASIGLSLAKHKDQIHRMGHDKDRYAMNYAKTNDVVDKVTLMLSGAVEKADIVFLALPFHEIYPVLEHISQDLKEDTLVIDTGPLKTPVLKWVDEFLPENCHYVGFTPVIASDHLGNLEFGPDTASADLFEGSSIGIVGGKNTTEKAINMAANLVQLLGATPLFTDPAEIDGLMTMTYILPRLMAASLLKTTQETPGWREARKIASRAYSQVTNPLSQDEITGALAAALQNNRENTTRVIDDLIGVLLEIRDMTDTASQEELEVYFRKVQKNRDLWLDDRKKGNWIETPQPEYKRRGMLAQLLGFRPRKKPQEDK
jgi:prephenate dehydrogenase